MDDAWREAKLSTFAAVRYGKATPRDSGTVPVIGSGGVFGATSVPLVEYPTLVIGRKGTAGKVWFLKKPSWPSDTTFYLEWKSADVDHAFLYYALQARPLSGEHARTTMPSLQRQDLEEYELSVPPLSEQCAIAHALQTVQIAREARQRELALERERKAALMEHLFTHGTRGEPLEVTEFGKVPKGWRLCQLCELVRTKITDGTHKTPTYVADGVPFITAKDIIANKIVFDRCSKISQEEHLVLSKRVRPERGDVLLTKVGTVGNAALVEDSREFSIFVQVALIKPKLDLLSPRFLLYSLQSERGQSELYNKSALSTMRFIGTQKIALLRIALPPFQEQLEISRALEASDAKVTSLTREVALLDELFRSMLEELMTGRLSAIPLIEERQQQ